MAKANFQKTLHFREHVENMVCFVYKYCELLQERSDANDFVEKFHSLSSHFKNFAIETVHKTLKDRYLLESSLRMIYFPDRINRLALAFNSSYSANFTDCKFIEWAIILCTLASLLRRQGFHMALLLALETIDAVSNYYSRYEAFACLGYNA